MIYALWVVCNIHSFTNLRAGENTRGNVLLRRELYFLIFFTSITSQGLLYEAKRQKTRKKVTHRIEETCCPQNESKILRTPPTEHQTIPQTALSPTAPPKRIKKFEHQTTRTTPCPTAPPKTNPKNLQTLTPRLEVRTPMAQAIRGKTSLFDLFS